MDFIVNAKAEEIEASIRSYVNETNRDGLFLFSNTINKIVGLPYIFLLFSRQSAVDRENTDMHVWGKVTLQENGASTLLFCTTEPRGIWDIHGKDFIRYEEEKKTYETILKIFAEKVREEFGDVKLEQVAKPPVDASAFEWLDYQEAQRKAGYKVTYKMLASMSTYSAETFKQYKKQWKLQRANN